MQVRYSKRYIDQVAGVVPHNGWSPLMKFKLASYRFILRLCHAKFTAALLQQVKGGRTVVKPRIITERLV